MLQGPSHFLVSSVQFLVPSSCVQGVASEMSNLFTSSYSFLVVTIWCTSWYFLEVLPPSVKSRFFILQILRNPPSLLLTAAVCLLLFPVSRWSYTAPSFSVFPCFLCSFGFLCNSSHFVLTLTFLDCFVFLSMIFDQSGLNFFFIICCLYLLEWFFFNLSANMCFRWSRACSFPFQEPSTSSFYFAHAIFYCSRLFSISSVSSVFL